MCLWENSMNLGRIVDVCVRVRDRYVDSGGVSRPRSIRPASAAPRGPVLAAVQSLHRVRHTG